MNQQEQEPLHGGFTQWVIHPAMREWLEPMLNDLGFIVALGPADMQSEDDLPVCFVFPKEMPRE